MNGQLNTLPNMLDLGLNHLIVNFYDFFQLNNFDLIVNHGALDVFYVGFCCALIPVIRLFRFAQNHTLPLFWKLGCMAMFYIICSIVFVITLASVLGVSNITLLYDLKGYPITFLQVLRATLFWDLLAVVGALIIGFFITHFIIKGDIEPYLEALTLRQIRKNSSGDKSLSDIRVSMGEIRTLDYNFFKYVNTKKGILMGLDDAHKPVYVPSSIFKETHVAVLGETGSGKGIASQMLLTQLHSLGSSLVIFDPKQEEFLYSVFKQYAQGEFRLIDLDAKAAQFNPIAHLNADRLYPILESAFCLKDKGQEADYHRGNERVNLRKALTLYQQGMTFDEWFKAIDLACPALLKTQEGQLNRLGQYFLDISLCYPIQGSATEVNFDLQKLLNEQGTLYVKCKLAKSSSSVKLATKIVLMAILDAIENRPINEEQHHVTIMLDELKFIITERVSQALGSIRNKGGSLVLNYQSEGDLANPDDITLDGRAIQQQINANTAIKICYKTLDNHNNATLSSLTGTVVKEARSNSVTTNEKLIALSNTGEARMMQQKETLYTENDFLSLPKRVAIMIGVGLAKRIYTTPVKVIKEDFPDFKERATPGYLESMLLLSSLENTKPELPQPSLGPELKELSLKETLK